MQFELGRPADEPAMRALLRDVKMPGRVALSLEREPDLTFANAVEGDRHDTIVARSAPGEPICAMGSRSIATRFVNGKPTRVGYLGQLRVADAYRSHPTLLRRGYEFLKTLRDKDAVPFYFTTIVDDNSPARRMLEAGLTGMPRYEPVDDLLTLIVPTRTHGRATDMPAQTSSATADDLSEIVDCLQRFGKRYQLSPAWSRSDLQSPQRSRGLTPSDFIVLRRAGTIEGCLACWDQRPFKQVVVRDYSAWTRRLRPVHNLLAPLSGLPSLPPPGAALSIAYLSHLAIEDSDHDGVTDLIRAGLRKAAARGIPNATFALSARHPLSSVVRATFRHQAFSSRVYLVDWDGHARHSKLECGTVTHPEAAIL